jgi:hypothetical protein
VLSSKSAVICTLCSRAGAQQPHHLNHQTNNMRTRLLKPPLSVWNLQLLSSPRTQINTQLFSLRHLNISSALRRKPHIKCRVTICRCQEDNGKIFLFFTFFFATPFLRPNPPHELQSLSFRLFHLYVDQGVTVHFPAMSNHVNLSTGLLITQVSEYAFLATV